jgi:hypothetical protein
MFYSTERLVHYRRHREIRSRFATGRPVDPLPRGRYSFRELRISVLANRTHVEHEQRKAGAGMERFSVCSPLGGELVEQVSAAARLRSLEGATIGELWNGVFKGDVSFPVIRQALLERFPGLKIVPFEEFPHLHGGDNPSQQNERAREVARMARDRGCDAVISGNGA